MKDKLPVKNIGYLAPEIPGLSSTFVYKEIFALEELGLDIFPASIHQNLATPNTQKLKNLKDKTVVLYKKNSAMIIRDNIAAFFNNPLRYLYVLSIALIDSLKYCLKPRVSIGIIYRFFIAGSYSSELSTRKIQHVHTHFAHFPADIAMYAGMLLKIPFSITAHANDIFSNSWLLKEKISRSKFIATISDYNKFFLTNLGFNSNKIHIVRCGVNPEEYKIKKPKKTTNPIPIIGFLGRLVEKKGVDTLIKSCAELNSRGVNFKLQIVGDGPLLDELIALSSSLNIETLCSFPGKIDNDKVFEWLSEIDLFVLAAKKDSKNDMDGIPVALMEAMLANTPVLSTTLSGIPELVIDHKTGLLSAPENSKELANNIELILMDQALREKIINAANEHVSNLFNTDINAQTLLNLITKND